MYVYPLQLMILTILESLSKTLFLPVDQITAALCLLLSFPFAFLLHSVIFWGQRRPCRRLVIGLSILPTYFFLWISFYVARPGAEDGKLSAFVWDVLSVHFPIGAVYLGLKYSQFFRRNPTLIFALLLAQLSYHHLACQLKFYNQYTVSMTGPLMVLIIKLSAFAYNVHDGEIDMAQVGLGGFLGWCLLFAGFFTGPVVTYRDYENFCLNRVAEGDVNRKVDVKKSTDKQVSSDKKNDDSYDSDSQNPSLNSLTAQQMKGRKRRATFLLLSAALLMLLGLLLQPHFPVQNLLQISESQSHSLLYKIVFMHLAMLGWRIKYYVAWSLAEGALVIVGLGAIFKDNKVKW